MSQFTEGQFEIPLSRLTVGYKNPAYFADKLLPIVPTDKQTGRYTKHSRDQFRSYDLKRSPGTVSKTANLSSSYGTFNCTQSHVEVKLPIEIKQNSDIPLQLEARSIDMAMQLLLVERELEARGIYFDAANYSDANFTDTLAGVTRWDDPGSDPISAFKAERRKIAKTNNLSGFDLLAVFGVNVFDALSIHEAVKDWVKYGGLKAFVEGQGHITPQVLAGVFRVREIVIPEAEYNDSNEGDADNMKYIWDPSRATVSVVPDKAPLSPEDPTPIYAASFIQKLEGTDITTGIEKVYREIVNSWIYKGAQMRDSELVLPNQGSFLWVDATNPALD